MKYYKYYYNDSVNKNCYKKRIKLLSKTARMLYHLREILFVVNLVFMLLLVTSLILLKQYIDVVESLNNGLRLFLQISVVASIIILPLMICVIIFKVIDKFVPHVSVPQINKKIVNECAATLKKYYKIDNNFIVTKCYKCSVKELTNKDLLLFIHNGNLRIVNDFTSTIKDFGCYEISRDELEYCYITENGLLSTHIKCNEIEFLLGKRAGSFIKQNLFN